MSKSGVDRLAFVPDPFNSLFLYSLQDKKRLYIFKRLQKQKQEEYVADLYVALKFKTFTVWPFIENICWPLAWTAPKLQVLEEKIPTVAHDLGLLSGMLTLQVKHVESCF